jgi:hypothetical protein
MRRYYVWRQLNGKKSFIRSVIARNANEAVRKVASTTAIKSFQSDFVAYPAGNPV